MDAVGLDAEAMATPEHLVARVQELQERLEATGDAATRAVADELVSAVVQMYGAGLERIVELLIGAEEDPGDPRRLAQALSEDELVAMLLLIHDLHPVPLEERVRAALESVRPYMESHGGGVELLSIRDGVATIHLRGSCSDCSASAVTLELAIKQALEEAAPDLEGLQVLGASAQTTGAGLPMATGVGPSNGSSGFELPMVMAGPAPAWYELEAFADPGDGALVRVRVAGSSLVVANVDGALLAYRDRCTACGAALGTGTVAQGALTCPGCARSYFLPRAGRSLDDDQIQLEPVPLLREHERVKVAV